ncbi:hypothetical protein GCM10025794_29680 [Massilia kyonggiensis]
MVLAIEKDLGDLQCEHQGSVALMDREQPLISDHLMIDSENILLHCPVVLVNFSIFQISLSGDKGFF